MRYIIIISIAFITLLASSCGNTCSIGAKTKVLTGRKWEISSYIDYSVNREISMPKEEYEFSADGTMLKVKNCDTIRETWDIPECDYLKIGTKIFKIAELSRKMMVLRYGDLDFVYRPKM